MQLCLTPAWFWKVYEFRSPILTVFELDSYRSLKRYSRWIGRPISSRIQFDYIQHFLVVSGSKQIYNCTWDSHVFSMICSIFKICSFVSFPFTDLHWSSSICQFKKTLNLCQICSMTFCTTLCSGILVNFVQSSGQLGLDGYFWTTGALIKVSGVKPAFWGIWSK